MSATCEACYESVPKIKDVKGSFLCEKCIAIKELTFDGNLHEDFVMVFFTGLVKISFTEQRTYFLFFTANRIIFAIYTMDKAGQEAGIATNRGKYSWTAGIGGKKIMRELALQPPEKVMRSFVNNFSVHYSDIQKINFKIERKYVAIEIVTDTETYNVGVEQRLSYGFESLLDKYLGHVADWSEISIIKPGSDLIKSLPEEKEFKLPFFIEDHLKNGFKEIEKYREKNDNEAIVNLITEILESANCSDITFQYLYSLRGSAFFSISKYNEAESDYNKSFEYADNIEQDDSELAIASAGFRTITEKAIVELKKAKSPCLIATVACDSENACEVRILREFRDRKLVYNKIGSKFISIYIKLSPLLANRIEHRVKLKKIVRIILIVPLAFLVNIIANKKTTSNRISPKG